MSGVDALLARRAAMGSMAALLDRAAATYPVEPGAGVGAAPAARDLDFVPTAARKLMARQQQQQQQRASPSATGAGAVASVLANARRAAGQQQPPARRHSDAFNLGRGRGGGLPAQLGPVAATTKAQRRGSMPAPSAASNTTQQRSTQPNPGFQPPPKAQTMPLPSTQRSGVDTVQRARARAERLVDARSQNSRPARRTPAARALGSAAEQQQLMERRVEAKLQERVGAELRRLRKVCEAADAAMPSRRNEPASAGTQAPSHIEFLESTLRALRQHSNHLQLVLQQQPTPTQPQDSGGKPPPRRPRSRQAAQPRGAAPAPKVSRPFPSWNRSILAEIYLCHACSCQEILRTETAWQGGAVPTESGSTVTGSPQAVPVPTDVTTGAAEETSTEAGAEGGVEVPSTDDSEERAAEAAEELAAARAQAAVRY
eukprot:COSAG01_NODE_7626_length_3122_cov_54.156136_1_plen_429_part_00